MIFANAIARLIGKFRRSLGLPPNSCISSINLDLYIRDLQKRQPGNPAIWTCWSYSQCGEDGIIIHILGQIAKKIPLTQTFIEIGCGNGIENNTHLLLLNNFRGCWLDGDEKNINYIAQKLGKLEHHQLKVTRQFLTRENIADYIANCTNFLNTNDIDFFSLDTDGNDLYFVREVLEILRPKILCVEYNAKFPVPVSLVVDYKESFVWDHSDYYGASLQAWVEALPDYKLISCSLNGVNAFFVNMIYADLFPDYTPAELYQPFRTWMLEAKMYPKSNLEWLRQKLNCS